MQIVEAKSVKSRVRKVRSLIESAGNHIGVVHFRKRSDNTKRRISYRLHVAHPQYVKAPTGKSIINPKDYDLITVFDTNTMRYNNKGRVCGRGGWKSIPLDKVIRVAVNGEIYKIVS